MVLSWVQGYLSGVAEAIESSTSPMKRLPDAGAIDGWLRNYCAQNPLADVSAGASVLAKELRR